MKNKPPKRRGDRRDAYLVRDADPLHAVMSRLLGGRTANEAVMSLPIDLTEAEAYLARRNEGRTEGKYTLFHLVCAALAKTLALRPKMNYFMKNRKLYEREDISLAFIAKNRFSDEGGESLVILKINEDDGAPSPLEQVHDRVCGEVRKIREERTVDGSTQVMNRLTSLPGFLLDIAVSIVRFLDRHGRLPRALRTVNPYDAGVFISNLGSIRMNAQYHHLSDFGTNSVFVIVGEKHWEPYTKADGSTEARMTLPLGITVDERIADGYYFAGSIRLIRYLLTHPALLEEPLYAEVKEEL